MNLLSPGLRFLRGRGLCGVSRSFAVAGPHLCFSWPCYSGPKGQLLLSRASSAKASRSRGSWHRCGAVTPTESQKPTRRERFLLLGWPDRAEQTSCHDGAHSIRAEGQRSHGDGNSRNPELPPSKRAPCQLVPRGQTQVAVSVKSGSSRGISRFSSDLQFPMRGPVWGRPRDWGDEKQQVQTQKKAGRPS